MERRHPGHATVDIITAAPYEWFERSQGSRWKRRDPDYDALQQEVADRMLAAIRAAAAMICPDWQ